MTRAHVETEPSRITPFMTELSMSDALLQAFRTFLRQPELGTDLSPLAHHLVERVAASIASHAIPAPGAPPAVVDGLILSSMRAAIDTIPAALAPFGELREGPEPAVRLRETLAGWARDDVALGSVLALLDRGFDIVFTALADRADTATRLTSDMKLLVDVRSTVTTAVVGVFATTDTRSVSASSRRTFATAILAGHTDIGHAREVGLEVHERYQVVSLAVGQPTGDAGIGRAPDEPRPRTRLESAVRRIMGGQALSLLSEAGGVILLPAADPDDLVDVETFAALSLAIGAEITATRVDGPADSIPDLALRADELLDLARAIGKPAGVYTMEDLVVEYQLTRPGPAHDRLAALIRPLEESSAELLETLRMHLSCGLNRRETARRLSVHPNTVDNRMSRVSAAIGLDLNRPRSIAQTQSAILAFDTARRRDRRENLAASR